MKLIKRKKPWVDLQYDGPCIPKNYSEPGVENGAKLEEHLVGNEDLTKVFHATKDMDLSASMAWL